MAKVYNTNAERAILHTVGAGKESITYRLLPKKLTDVPDDVLTVIRFALTDSQNAELVEGDADIAKARSSAQALVNAANARAEAKDKENAELRAQVQALEAANLELKAKGKR